jgi:phosphoglycolate phosphatase-like HAD superfamily hydrolase
MVGDSAVDIRTARNASIQACGVSYGFQPESFVQEPPDVVVDNADELTAFVLSGVVSPRL